MRLNKSSKILIWGLNCLSGAIQLHNIILRPMTNQLHDITRLLIHIEFSHIFRELKTINKLTKEGTLLLKN